MFADVFAFNPDTLQVKGPTANENIPGVLVSGQFFRALATAPLVGRYLSPEDDGRGGSPAGLAVVISEGFWQTWFDRAPDVVGRKLVIANVPFTVVGVMPKRFIGADPTQKPEIFAPLAADPIIDAPRNHIDDGMNAWWLTVGARLRPGVTLAQANASLAAVSGPILHQAPAAPALIADQEKAHFHFSRARLPRFYLCPHDVSQAARSHVPHVRRHSSAGLPEPGQPVDGTRRGAGAGVGDENGHWRYAAATDPTIAGGKPTDCDCPAQPPG